VEIGDFDSACAAQEKIIELDPDNQISAWADLLIAATTGNAAAVRETVNWLLPRTEVDSVMLQALPRYYLYVRDLPRTLELTLQCRQELLEPDSWEQSLQSPIYDPIRHEPRMQVIFEDFQRLLAIQRDEIEAIRANSETGDPF